MGITDQGIRRKLYLRSSMVHWKPGYDTLKEEDYVLHNFIYLNPTMNHLGTRVVVVDLIISMDESTKIISRLLGHE